MLSQFDSEQAWCLQEELEVPAALRRRINRIRTQRECLNLPTAIEELSELFAQSYSTSEEWLSLAQEGIRYDQFENARQACCSAETLGFCSPASWCVYAGLLYELGELEKGETAYREAIEFYPASIALAYRFGTFLIETGRPQDAIDLYESLSLHGLVVNDSAWLPEIYASFAVAKLALGMNEEAIELLFALLSLNSEHRDFDYLMGLALNNLKVFEQAADFFRKALPRHMYRIDIVVLLADCLRQIDRPDLSIEVYEDALRRFPGNPEHEVLSLNNAQMYFRLGENERAIETYELILASDPEHVLASYLLLASLSACGNPQVSRMRSVAENLWRSFRAGNSLPIRRASIANYSSKESKTHANERLPRKIKVGILSSEIGDHVVGMFMTPLLENFNRDRFSIHLISCRDLSDARADYLRSLACSTVSLGGLNEVEAREVIRDQAYDIILETSGYTHSPSLFILAERCAPIQCHYIGFHATTGLDTIDYYIGDDEILAPAFADQFSETFWPLPRPWLARSHSDGLPLAVARATHDGPIFGCFSSLQKVSDTTLSFWGEAMRSVPASVLLLKDRLTAVPSLRHKILGALERFGVDPSRVSFLGKTISWQEHMDAFNLIDIAFDTTPWSGATTAFDTLSMGVPLIGIRGNATSGRMSSSVLRAIGAQEWITCAPAEFARLARLLADDFQKLRKEKQDLQNRVLASSLFDGAGLAKELESAFEQMIDIARQAGTYTPAGDGCR